jgi:predicted esterase
MCPRHLLQATALVFALALGCTQQGPAPSGNQTTPADLPKAADDWKRPPEIQETIAVQRYFASGNVKQQYFLMRQRNPARSTDKYGLVVILPGGPGTAEFLPFGANVLTAAAIPDDFLAAQLVAPQWRQSDDRIVWPSHVFPDDKAEFTTETFLAAVIDEVSRKLPIDERFVFTLGWSSSGHALYSASTRVPKVRGAVIAMSRFLPGRSVEMDKLKGKAYFLYHSPEDTVCPFADAELAAKTLKEQGAQVKLVTYKGGHGWVPFTYYADSVREGILWLKESSAAGLP